MPGDSSSFHPWNLPMLAPRLAVGKLLPCATRGTFRSIPR
jgi:hypothetical protein